MKMNFLTNQWGVCVCVIFSKLQQIEEYNIAVIPILQTTSFAPLAR